MMSLRRIAAVAITLSMAFPAALPLAAQQSPFRTSPSATAVAVSELLDRPVYASSGPVSDTSAAGVQPDWSEIGAIRDIVIGRDGKVEAVLLDIGGYLGVGETRIALDFSALHFVADGSTPGADWFLVLQADRQMLGAAPLWAPGGAGPTAPDLPAGYKAMDNAELTPEMLRGVTVRDAAGTEVGQITDLVMTSEGLVTEAILDIGTYLGIGSHVVSIPVQRLLVAQPATGVGLRVWETMTIEELHALSPVSALP